MQELVRGECGIRGTGHDAVAGGAALHVADKPRRRIHELEIRSSAQHPDLVGHFVGKPLVVRIEKREKLSGGFRDGTIPGRSHTRVLPEAYQTYPAITALSFHDAG